MKYRSINNFQDFEFHDCVFSLISWENDRLTISAKHLNIHETAEQNTFGSDMEIDEAHIIFYGFQLNEFEPSRNWYQDANGNLQTNEPLIIYKGTKARSMFENELLNSFVVIGIAVTDGEYELGAIGIDPYFSARFIISDIEILWDNYIGPSWYKKCSTDI